MNVFVTVGTTEFSKLIESVDYIIGQLPKYNVEAQIGMSKFIPKNIKYYKYTDDINSCIEWADIVITHGGAGTVYQLLERNRRIIVVPNPNVRANHQVEIANFVSKNNYGTALFDTNHLLDALLECENENFKQYANNNEDLINYLVEIINEA
jgi:beta-1,4-N-acetylglucosaminyltransferase